MNNFYIVTFGSNENNFRYLKNSSKLYDANITFLTGIWTGKHDKIFEIKKFLQDKNDNDIICFIDAYDVLMCSSTETILQKFLATGYDLVVSAEINCHPSEFKTAYMQIDEIPKFNPNKTSHIYLNSCGYIGRKFAIMDLFNWKTDEEIIEMIKIHQSDQHYFHYYLIENYEEKNISLDHDTNIFLTLSYVNYDDLVVNDEKIYNIPLKTNPCFLHFNEKSYCAINKRNGMYCNVMQIFLNAIRQKNNQDFKFYKQRKQYYSQTTQNNI